MSEDPSVLALVLALVLVLAVVFPSMATEKRTLLSFLSPVSGVVVGAAEYTSPLPAAGFAENRSRRPSKRSGSRAYRVPSAGQSSFISQSDG